MKAILLSSIWGFIFLAALYDACFAWNHRDLFEVWEWNPLASWIAVKFGLLSFFGIKFAGLLFAGAVTLFCWSRRRRELVLGLTLTIGGIYAALSMHYLLNREQLAYTPPAIPIALQPAVR